VENWRSRRPLACTVRCRYYSSRSFSSSWKYFSYVGKLGLFIDHWFGREWTEFFLCSTHLCWFI
jgi:hypothetical protein